ncbi:MAG: hypothetical protein OEL56_01185 [Nitrosopumilus sp.]|nr:hypothetical protein [Nitrosopumilus sp.]MDH3515274.1 hypothetical protein [Nitrosopumilus sp.]MDH3564424.1 hypothetical protein [Nitrosopumilus sp.]MDH5417581.1 hypothetical protein [Nitrosopumilus sp.]MDH5554366.1 hypothetical protein [Nitrosopumilus sp.]
MTLSDKEKIIAIISNGITVFSLLQERDDLPKNTTMYDFVMKVIPENIKAELNVELIDEVFQYVSSAHNSWRG